MAALLKSAQMKDNMLPVPFLVDLRFVHGLLDDALLHGLDVCLQIISAMTFGLSGAAKQRLQRSSLLIKLRN